VIEHEAEESIRQLAITSAGSGWSGEAAKELCEKFEQIRNEAQMNGKPPGEPKPQIALSVEEFLRQIQ
jgi:hypothetical protein